MFAMASFTAINHRRSVLYFTFAYLLGIFSYTLFLRNWEFQFYVLIVFLVVLCIIRLNRLIRFSTIALWTMSLTGLMHLLGGLVHVPDSWPIIGTRHVLYNLWLIPGVLKYDNIIHFYGYAICMWVIWQVCRAILPMKKTWLQIAIAVLAANGVGACNEVIEFFAWRVLTETNIGGYADTSWDLIYNFLGSVAAALAVRYGRPLRRSAKP